MTPADYVQFVTLVLLLGFFMWMRREYRELRIFIDSRFDKLDERFDKLDERFDKLIGRFDKLIGRFEGVNGRIDGL